jgi:hypothetical protein
VAEPTRLAFFVPVKLVNTSNAREHWSADAKRAAAHRDAVCASVLAAKGRREIEAAASRAKVVRFEAWVPRLFDDDGLRTALKHVRDGLMDARLIDGDAPRNGHLFTYHQARRRPYGVTVTVTLRAKETDDAEEASEGGHNSSTDRGESGYSETPA